MTIERSGAAMKNQLTRTDPNGYRSETAAAETPRWPGTGERPRRTSRIRGADDHRRPIRRGRSLGHAGIALRPSLQTLLYRLVAGKQPAGADRLCRVGAASRRRGALRCPEDLLHG